MSPSSRVPGICLGTGGAVLGLLSALTVLLFALPASGHTSERAGSSAFPPAFTVDAFGGNFANDDRELDLTVDLAGEADGAGRISLYVPDRFQLVPSRDPGDPVGKAFLFLRNPPSATTPFTRYSGSIAAEPIDAAGEAAAQACSPGTHIAIWLLELRHLAQTLDLPIYLASTEDGDPPGAALKLELCPGAASGADLRDPSGALASIVLSLADIEPPATPGSYRWRAIITPRLPGGPALDAAAAYELRALVPVPHVLTLRGRYLPAAHRALLTGSLRARGGPQQLALVWLTELNRTVTVHGPVFHDSTASVTGTRRDGTYSVALPLHASRGFLAASPPTIGSCTGSSPAPAGCRSATVAGIESDPITLSVP